MDDGETQQLSGKAEKQGASVPQASKKHPATPGVALGKPISIFKDNSASTCSARRSSSGDCAGTSRQGSQKETAGALQKQQSQSSGGVLGKPASSIFKETSSMRRSSSSCSGGDIGSSQLVRFSPSGGGVNRVAAEESSTQVCLPIAAKAVRTVAVGAVAPAGVRKSAKGHPATPGVGLGKPVSIFKEAGPISMRGSSEASEGEADPDIHVRFAAGNAAAAAGHMGSVVGPGLAVGRPNSSNDAKGLGGAAQLKKPKSAERSSKGHPPTPGAALGKHKRVFRRESSADGSWEGEEQGSPAVASCKPPVVQFVAQSSTSSNSAHRHNQGESGEAPANPASVQFASTAADAAAGPAAVGKASTGKKRTSKGHPATPGAALGKPVSIFSSSRSSAASPSSKVQVHPEAERGSEQDNRAASQSFSGVQFMIPAEVSPPAPKPGRGLSAEKQRHSSKEQKTQLGEGTEKTLRFTGEEVLVPVMRMASMGPAAPVMPAKAIRFSKEDIIITAQAPSASTSAVEDQVVRDRAVRFSKEEALILSSADKVAADVCSADDGGCAGMLLPNARAVRFSREEVVISGVTEATSDEVKAKTHSRSSSASSGQSHGVHFLTDHQEGNMLHVHFTGAGAVVDMASPDKGAVGKHLEWELKLKNRPPTPHVLAGMNQGSFREVGFDIGLEQEQCQQEKHLQLQEALNGEQAQQQKNLLQQTVQLSAPVAAQAAEAGSRRSHTQMAPQHLAGGEQHSTERALAASPAQLSLMKHIPAVACELIEAGVEAPCSSAESSSSPDAPYSSTKAGKSWTQKLSHRPPTPGIGLTKGVSIFKEPSKAGPTAAPSPPRAEVEVAAGAAAEGVADSKGSPTRGVPLHASMPKVLAKLSKDLACELEEQGVLIREPQQQHNMRGQDGNLEASTSSGSSGKKGKSWAEKLANRPPTPGVSVGQPMNVFKSHAQGRARETAAAAVAAAASCPPKTGAGMSGSAHPAAGGGFRGQGTASLLTTALACEVEDQGMLLSDPDVEGGSSGSSRRHVVNVTAAKPSTQPIEQQTGQQQQDEHKEEEQEEEGLSSSDGDDEDEPPIEVPKLILNFQSFRRSPEPPKPKSTSSSLNGAVNSTAVATNSISTAAIVAASNNAPADIGAGVNAILPQQSQQQKKEQQKVCSDTGRKSPAVNMLLGRNADLATEVKEAAMPAKGNPRAPTPGATLGKPYNMFRDEDEDSEEGQEEGEEEVRPQQAHGEIDAEQQHASPMGSNSSHSVGGRTSPALKMLLGQNADLATEIQEAKQRAKGNARAPTPGATLGRPFNMFRDGDDNDDEEEEELLQQQGEEQALRATQGSSTVPTVQTSPAPKAPKAWLGLKSDLATEVEEAKQKAYGNPRAPTPGATLGRPFNMFRDGEDDEEEEELLQQQGEEQALHAAQVSSTGPTGQTSSASKAPKPWLGLKSDLATEVKEAKQKAKGNPRAPTPGATLGRPFNMFRDGEDDDEEAEEEEQPLPPPSMQQKQASAGAAPGTSSVPTDERPPALKAVLGKNAHLATEIKEAKERARGQARAPTPGATLGRPYSMFRDDSGDEDEPEERQEQQEEQCQQEHGLQPPGLPQLPQQQQVGKEQSNIKESSPATHSKAPAVKALVGHNADLAADVREAKRRPKGNPRAPTPGATLGRPFNMFRDDNDEEVEAEETQLEQQVQGQNLSTGTCSSSSRAGLPGGRGFGAVSPRSQSPDPMAGSKAERAPEGFAPNPGGAPRSSATAADSASAEGALGGLQSDSPSNGAPHVSDKTKEPSGKNSKGSSRGGSPLKKASKAAKAAAEQENKGTSPLKRSSSPADNRPTRSSPLRRLAAAPAEADTGASALASSSPAETGGAATAGQNSDSLRASKPRQQGLGPEQTAAPSGSTTSSSSESKSWSGSPGGNGSSTSSPLRKTTNAAEGDHQQQSKGSGSSRLQHPSTSADRDPSRSSPLGRDTSPAAGPSWSHTAADAAGMGSGDKLAGGNGLRGAGDVGVGAVNQPLGGRNDRLVCGATAGGLAVASGSAKSSVPAVPLAGEAGAAEAGAMSSMEPGSPACSSNSACSSFDNTEASNQAAAVKPRTASSPLQHATRALDPDPRRASPLRNSYSKYTGLQS
jgi:hypothetical protein